MQHGILGNSADTKSCSEHAGLKKEKEKKKKKIYSKTITKAKGDKKTKLMFLAYVATGND